MPMTQNTDTHDLNEEIHNLEARLHDAKSRLAAVTVTETEAETDGDGCRPHIKDRSGTTPCMQTDTSCIDI